MRSIRVGREFSRTDNCEGYLLRLPSYVVASQVESVGQRGWRSRCRRPSKTYMTECALPDSRREPVIVGVVRAVRAFAVVGLGGGPASARLQQVLIVQPRRGLARFGGVHRRVGVEQKGGGGGAVGRIVADADTCSDQHRLSIDQQPVVQGADDVAGDGGRGVRG